MLQIIKRVIARCVVASLWIIWIVVVLGRSKENRGSAAEFSLDYELAYKKVKRDVYLIAA